LVVEEEGPFPDHRVPLVVAVALEVAVVCWAVVLELQIKVMLVVLVKIVQVLVVVAVVQVKLDSRGQEILVVQVVMALPQQ
jgi:hypothetical protein